ncbi:MAG: hypothetical protein IJ667_04455 [Synergistaceae bacterium]|nr:hypothetical protein [Synergistaceae bacterium]
MANGPVNVSGSPETSANMLDMPYAAATLIYTGVKQSPAWINYDAAKLDISGELYGIEARAYTVNFTPKAGYIWRDGTQESKSAVWLINKSQVTVSMEAKEDLQPSDGL